MSKLFYMAKEAALDEVCDLVDNEGFGLADVHDVVVETLGQDLHKHASEQDLEVRLGTEAFCYSFLKHASESFGNGELNGTDEENLIYVLAKVAADDSGSGDSESKPSLRQRAAKKVEAGKQRLADSKLGQKWKNMDPAKRNQLKGAGKGAAALGATIGTAAALKKGYDYLKDDDNKGQKKTAAEWEVENAIETLMAYDLLEY